MSVSAHSFEADFFASARRFVFEQPVQVARLVRDLADRAQVATQRSWKRPYGVGVLSAGHDKTGAHLFYNCPSGAYYDYKAMAIGARSQVRYPWRHAFSGEPAGQHLGSFLAEAEGTQICPKATVGGAL